MCLWGRTNVDDCIMAKLMVLGVFDRILCGLERTHQWVRPSSTENYELTDVAQIQYSAFV